MTKKEIIAAMVDKTSVHHSICERMFEVAIESMKESLANGENIYLRGFGTFEVKKRKARPGRNIRTNETIMVPARMDIKFKKSDNLIIKN